MKLIVGLGNPGRKYAQTRHNLGYQVMDLLAQRWRIEVHREKFNGLFGSGRWAGQDVALLKPTTFMNRSGESVLAAKQFYKLPPNEVLVVLDDLALPIGRIRVRPDGSSGGHKGLEDILQRLGTLELARVRVGIGAAEPGRTVEYVLSPVAEDEAPLLIQALTSAVDAVECWVRDGIQECMNRFNSPPGARCRDKSSGDAAERNRERPEEK